jgi:hypothetical protein
MLTILRATIVTIVKQTIVRCLMATHPQLLLKHAIAHIFFQLTALCQKATAKAKVHLTEKMDLPPDPLFY